MSITAHLFNILAQNYIRDRFKMEKMLKNSKCLFTILVLFLASTEQVFGAQYITCYNPKSKCFLKPLFCPNECPYTTPANPKNKACFLNCNKPTCQPECKKMKPDCEGHGAACHDPRFIGGDGIVFYFHGKRNEHFTLVSDPNLHINARFIGLRPADRQRDFTWIQALGIRFHEHSFTVEATKASTWDDEVDHLKLSHNNQDLELPEGYPSLWKSSEENIKVERSSDKNSVTITFGDAAEISVNVVPVTKEDDRIHNYRIPSHDCFAHLEVQFRFYALSSNVEGVIGRTYQPDFVNPAKPGVAMPVVGGEDKYRTSSLLDTDCGRCIFSPDRISVIPFAEVVQGSLDCTSGLNGGNGIVCRR